jgi:uncharacterized phage protein (TIGR02218 family)
VTQAVVEVASSAAEDTTQIVLTQEAVETLSDAAPALDITQLVIEVASSPIGVVMTAETVEALSDADPGLVMTAEAVEVISRDRAEARHTRFVRLMLVSPPTAIARQTRFARLTLAEMTTAAHQSRFVRLTLADAVPCLTYWAHMWRLERTDGEVFTFTSHDRDLQFRGEIYRTCASLSASASELGSLLGDVGNMELAGVISDETIKENELFAGLFDGAEIEVWLFPWSDAGGETPRRLIAGNTGNLAQRINGFTMEVLTVGQLLQQRSVVEIVTPACRFDLGDARCTVNLEALRLTGTVDAIATISARSQTNKRTFFDTTRTEASGYWDLGMVTFTSGDNAGLSVQIKSYDLATGEFVLWDTTLAPIEVGDTFSMVPGCDKTTAACKDKFANFINFGGFPDIPGGDEIARTPNAGGGGVQQSSGGGGGKGGA